MDPAAREQFWESAWSGEMALHADLANEQHYEVPASFFSLVLGPRKKYSAAYWPEGVDQLGAAEGAMLELYAERAGLRDGQSILDLGCGWGSFTLWAAERFPGSQIVAVSNSSSQREHIEAGVATRGLRNIEVVTSDITGLELRRRFDRVVTVEMLEHVRNHRAVFQKLRAWLEASGAVFVHVFAHRQYAYPFSGEGPGSWMARTFFTGGAMPSRALLPAAAHPLFQLADDWWIDGTHYARTLESWLTRLDEHEAEVRTVLEPVYGADVELWVQRWRMFFMACAEMFGYRNGTEWGVAQHLLRPV